MRNFLSGCNNKPFAIVCTTAVTSGDLKVGSKWNTEIWLY